MPSLANLRSHKNKAVNFTPSKAYWILGHGGEPNDGSTFTVPPGCIIVVKVSPGQLSYVNQKIFVTLDKEKLKDPIKNSNYLVKNFGSFAIFKPGDQCPIFDYQLLACFPSNPLPGEEPFNKCSTLGSGVVDIDNVYNSQTDNLPVPEGDILEYIANLYKDSAYPTKQQVKDTIANFTTNESLTSVQKLNLIWNTLLSDICLINQENLCKKLGGGVYYNFVCRYRGKASDNVYDKNSLIYNDHSWHSSAKGVEELQSNNFALLRNKIGEAEIKRKGLLRNYYASPEYKPPEQIKHEKLKPIILDRDHIFKSRNVLFSYINERTYTPLSKIINFLENIEYYRGSFTVDEIINYNDWIYDETPLSRAITLNMPELFALLIFLGAKTDITIRSRDGVSRRTLMDIALGTNEPRVVNMLEFVMNKTPSELLKIHQYSKKFGISNEFSKEKGFSKEIENYYKQERGKTARNFKQPTNWLKQKSVIGKSSLYKGTRPSDLFWQITYSDNPNENIIKTINLIMSTNFSSTLLHPSEFIYLKSSDDIINYVDDGKWSKPGETPLWLAVKMDRIPLIKPLLKAGANSSIKVDEKTLAEIASPAAMAELGITGPVLGGKRSKNKKRQTRRYRTRRTITRKNA